MRNLFLKSIGRWPSAPTSFAKSQAVLVAVASLTAMAITSPAAGQATDIAYVEAVTGRATASAKGETADLGDLDLIYQGTQLELSAGTELRLCHYRLRKLVTLTGPMHAVISAAGISTSKGVEITSAREACAAPVVSVVEGGAAYRAVVPATIVGLRPSIKLSSTASAGVRGAAIWDDDRHPVTTLQHGMAKPQLTDGKEYALVVELSDGRQWRLPLRANATSDTLAIILVLR